MKILFPSEFLYKNRTFFNDCTHDQLKVTATPTSLLPYRFGLMKSCWMYRPEDRPEFEELASSLNNELTALAEYVDLSMFAEESNVNIASEE